MRDSGNCGFTNSRQGSLNTTPGALPVLGGVIREDHQAWLKNSPMMYVESIKTPTLIQHGRLDQNVNIDQSSELDNALNARKMPVQMVAYRDQAHALLDKAAIESSNVTFEGLEKYVRP